MVIKIKQALIVIRDMLRQLVLKIKMLRQRILVPAYFTQPTSLSHTCCNIRVISPEKLTFPEEFLACSRSYRSRPVPEFAGEDVYACTLDREASVHQARFVHLGSDQYLDVGNQDQEPCAALRKPFVAKPTELCTNLIVPWGGGGASYGDFIIKVLPKLARLWETIPKDERHDLRVCLPYFDRHAWALDYLALLGITGKQILNGSTTILVPAGGRMILGSGPKPGHCISHPHDIRSMIRQLALNIPSPQRKPWRRLYISRKTGRKMANEAALLGGLTERGFDIIYLEDLSLHDQISLFQEASVVVGPHGAGHANIIWSSQGTRLLEIFHPSWMHPCYALISQILGISYHCLVGYHGDSKGSCTEKSRYGIFEDPSIDPEIFFRKVDRIIPL